MSDQTAGDVLAALRHATSAQHELLDSGLAIASPDAGLRDYQLHLHMLLAWIAPLEAWLSTFVDGPQGHPMLAPVPRAARIAHDLADPAFAGLPLPPPLSDPAPWPAHASAAYRWGVCYVVEGSQLGGAVLYQRLGEQLAPHPLTYLRGEAGGPGVRWRTFMLALREQVQRGQDVADACQGARDAFDRILTMRSALHP